MNRKFESDLVKLVWKWSGESLVIIFFPVLSEKFGQVMVGIPVGIQNFCLEALWNGPKIQPDSQPYPV